ncbi:hypothetical protein M8J76_007891 [Diaphorina citri]|nr:hypothetical protein M8J76_007891 [Diaphorina citri]
MLVKRLEELETEKKKNQEEFGQQRAKMKDLKLTGEVKTLQSDLDEARSQITVAELSLQSRLEETKRRYEEEISSLQRLVAEHFNGQDTAPPPVHSSPLPPPPSSYEVETLRKTNEKLATELTQLRAALNQAQYEPLLTAPSAMFNTLRKLSTNVATGVTSVATGSVLPSGDSLEEERRKAEEDAEVLRSLVVPLEDEIKLLKQMLRTTDEELRKYKKLTPHLPHSIQDCVGELTQKSATVEGELRELRETYGHTFDEVRRQVQQLEDERRQCLDRIEA